MAAELNECRRDVRDRGAGLDPGGDEYWTLVAEVAVEAVLHDIAHLAKEDGAVFSRDTFLIAEDPDA
ncbi:hypothetical protein OOZ19_23370 [Saccharopolyspora sp. NFXS83]|uniref:hypothetical protein n=1 Tax=Saccharopolyspora sp. NFXS83 TaxID=2993560 RepID=UPI00224A5823|nr:hypothetical protein [Saccharopolyspora sp. NFXS83]MCX2733193.1 hypothetical protein [Saccharopolyspora sp. NFXS83]